MMAIQRYQPISLLQQFNDEINRMFTGQTEALSALSNESAGQWRPVVDVHESPEAYVIEAEVPGIAPESIEVTLRDGSLVLSGERVCAYDSKDGAEAEKSNERKQSRHIERHYGRFVRRLALPDTANVELIEAHAEQGVLRVTVPKKENVLPRRIEVQRG